MQKLEQLKQELKALVKNPNLDNIIDEKIDDAWRYARDELNTEWCMRERRYCQNLKGQLSPGEQKRMEESHRWSWSNNPEDENKCIVCELTDHGMFMKPQFCDDKQTD